MSRALAIAVCALVLVLPATVQKGGAQKGGGSTTSNLPVVNSLSPATKEAGMGSFVMTVSGANFTTGSVVRWNGSNVSTGYVASTQLNATIASSLVANTGTSYVTVFTSGRKGGTSNSLAFTIKTPTTTAPPPAPAPAPSPTPLSITTSSLPGGTANASFSSTVGATGGAPAYGWGLVNGGGSLPPGLTLQATGAISGTPTQSGTFTFTTQASDQSSQIAQRVLSITVAADPNATTPTTTTSSGYILQDDFEGGTFSKWNGYVSLPDASVVTSTSTAPKPVHSGSKAAQFRFPPGSIDINRYAAYMLPANTTHFFIRGYVYFQTPVSGMYGQRKIFYVKGGDSGNLSGGAGFCAFAVLTSDMVPWLGNGMQVRPRISAGNCQVGETSYPRGTTMLDLNTWYGVEMEVQMNTPGAADGYYNVWINGVKETALCQTGVMFRGANMPDAWNAAQIGVQLDPYDANLNPLSTSEEYRYWDDVVISSSYIGQ